MRRIGREGGGMIAQRWLNLTSTIDLFSIGVARNRRLFTVTSNVKQINFN